jgi:hypothetical protein
VSSFLGHEQDISIIKKYDRKSLQFHSFEELSTFTFCDKLWNWICKLKGWHKLQFIYICKNWPDDPKVDCKSLCYLIKFTVRNEHLNEELEEFESEFQQDKILKIEKL